MAITPAADNRAQSKPAAVDVVDICTASGMAAGPVKVRAIRSSTQLNMKVKNIVTPIPARIIGMKMVRKKVTGKPTAPWHRSKYLVNGQDTHRTPRGVLRSTSNQPNCKMPTPGGIMERTVIMRKRNMRMEVCKAAYSSKSMPFPVLILARGIIAIRGNSKRKLTNGIQTCSTKTITSTTISIVQNQKNRIKK